MTKGLKRRAIAAALLLVALCAAALTCALINRRDAVTAAAAQPALALQQEADALSQFRTEREQLRQQQKAQLNELIYNASSDGETIRLAQRKLMEIIDRESAEVRLEGLLRARGFDDVLVSVSGESVNVLVRREALTQRETAVILEPVLRETGITSGNVKIIPVN